MATWPGGAGPSPGQWLSKSQLQGREMPRPTLSCWKIQDGAPDYGALLNSHLLPSFSPHSPQALTALGPGGGGSGLGPFLGQGEALSEGRYSQA